MEKHFDMDLKSSLFLFTLALIQLSLSEDVVTPACQPIGGEVTLQCVCPSGYTYDNETCKDIDECDLQNGSCQHSCVNSIGSYSCECKIGYQLANDNHRCDDFDECSLNSGDCPESQTCVNTWGGNFCSQSIAAVTQKPEALNQIGEKLLKKDVIIGLIAWLVIVTMLVLTTIAVMVRQTPNRREKSLTQQAAYSEKNPDYFFPEFWPHVSVSSRNLKPDNPSHI